MNNKEAIQFLDNMKHEEAGRAIGKDGFYVELMGYHVEALNTAIKALEQEPCDDAINREDALMCLTGEIKDTDTIETIIARFVRRIRKLPPVNTQPKTGHWIFVDKAHEHAHCSKCDYGNVDLLNGRPHNYCPNCGARIVDTQEESEEQV